MSLPRVVRRADPAAVEAILRSLPGWFGIEEAILGYVESASRLECYLALEGQNPVGVALVDQRYPESAELSLIAVHANHRGRGVGWALIQSVEATVAARGASVLQVHTVGPSFDDDGYAATRAFYQRVGFVPVQEIFGLDWDGPTLIMVKPLSTPTG